MLAPPTHWADPATPRDHAALRIGTVEREAAKHRTVGIGELRGRLPK
jgi:hypothetical protein